MHPRPPRLFPDNPPLLSDKASGSILVLVVAVGAILRRWDSSSASRTRSHDPTKK